MKWEDFIKRTTPEPMFVNMVKTDVECPKCGNNLYCRTDIVLTSLPAQYQYECPACNFVGYSHVKWSKIR